MISYILAVICGLLVLGVDQLTKLYIVSNFSLGQSADFLKGILNITYIHNRGAAWGMLSGYTAVLLIITVLVMAICVLLLVKFGIKSKLMFWAVNLTMFGGIGNLIDRIFRNGNVVDFLQFDFWKQFPIFNVADCSIVIGAGLLILYFVIDSVREAKLEKQKQEEYADN